MGSQPPEARSCDKKDAVSANAEIVGEASPLCSFGGPVQSETLGLQKDPPCMFALTYLADDFSGHSYEVPSRGFPQSVCIYSIGCHILSMADHMVKITFTIDPATAASLRELAEEWGVPKSEAFRRVVRQAKEQHLLQTRARTPSDVLEHLEHHPSLSTSEKKARLASARRLRKEWDLRGAS